MTFKEQNRFMSLLFADLVSFRKMSEMAKPGGGRTSISSTGMLVREQISTTPKNRMPQNSNPKIRMTEDAMFVKV